MRNAIESWELVKRYYRLNGQHLQDDTKWVQTVVEYLERHNWNGVLFGSTSHDLLLISPDGQYTTLDSVRIGAEDDHVRVEFFNQSTQSYDVVAMVSTAELAEFCEDSLPLYFSRWGF